MNVAIESIGAYLPQTRQSTEQVLAGCATPLALPLRRLTGIAHRRIVTPGELTVALAVQAAQDCLARSRSAEPIDMVLACHISRIGADPEPHVAFEPCTAAHIADRLGLAAAAIDISNACAGMFTGIWAAQLMIMTGAYRRVLVVSGEYTSHLIITAQREISSIADSRLACLTVGDAGVAVVLEAARTPGTGFLALDLRTRPQHSGLCIGRLSDSSPAAIMYTDAVRLAAVSITEATTHITQVVSEAAMQPEDFDFIIAHQTSTSTLQSAARHLNDTYGRAVCTPQNMVDNLAERGNTASTTQLLALYEGMRDGRIRSGQRVLFSVTGSGLTIGTALYQLDDLPNQVNSHHPTAAHDNATPPTPLTTSGPSRGIRILAAVGGLLDPNGFDTVTAAADAAGTAIRHAEIMTDEVDLLLYTGVYRTGFVFEPSIGALIAGTLTPAFNPAHGRAGPLTFDVFGGAVGLLHSCHLAHLAIEAGKAEHVVVVTAETDNNRQTGYGTPQAIATGAAALVLAKSDKPGGFVAFAFASATDRIDLRHSTAIAAARSPGAPVDGLTVQLTTAVDISEEYAALLRTAIARLRQHTRHEPFIADWVLSPFARSALSESCREALGIAATRWVDIDSPNDLITLALPLAIGHLVPQASPGELILLLAAGAGLSAGAAIYQV